MWFMDTLKSFWNKTKEWFNKFVDYSSVKITESWTFSILNRDDLDELINASATKEFQNPNTWELKYFKKKSVLVVTDEKSHKKISLLFPILKTKAFSANIAIKLSKEKVEGINYSEFNLEEFPVLVLFEDKEITKIINWEENIEKIAKSIKINLDEIIETF